MVVLALEARLVVGHVSYSPSGTGIFVVVVVELTVAGPCTARVAV